MDNARQSITDILNEALYETTQTTKKIESIDILVDATSTVGGLVRTTETYFQSTVTASGSFAAQGLSDMRTLFNTVSSSAGKDSPDFIISTQSAYESYESVLQPQERFADAAMADGGFQSLRFKGAPFVYDANIATGRLYMLSKLGSNMLKLFEGFKALIKRFTVGYNFGRESKISFPLSSVYHTFVNMVLKLKSNFNFFFFNNSIWENRFEKSICFLGA